jgi:rRNA methylases
MEFDGLGTIVVLPKAQDPGNAGTIVRAADAFGAAGVVACVGTVDLTSPKVIRMSTGSVFHLGIREGMVFEQAIEQAKASGLMVCGTAMEGEPLTALPGDTNIAWVFGNEAKGLSEEEKSLCDRLVSIPMSGNAESLNVSVAAGICLYQSQELRNGR